MSIHIASPRRRHRTLAVALTTLALTFGVGIAGVEQAGAATVGSGLSLSTFIARVSASTGGLPASR